MTRKELIEQEAQRLGQMYSPDESNIWARPNYEAQFVSNACMQMANFVQKLMIDGDCEWLQNNVDFYVETKYDEDFRVDTEQLLKDLRKAMEK